MRTDFRFSLLYPDNEERNKMSPVTIHDLGLDSICKKLSSKESEQTYILKVMSEMTDDAHVSEYRSAIFEDIYTNPGLRSNMMEILERINFLRDYGSFKREHEEAASTWELVHRLEEINDYISCVEALQKCLGQADIHSEGLISLKQYIGEIYSDRAFGELKKDISAMRASTSELKSVTVGINLNNRYEAESVGIVSINSRSFTKSGVIGNFSDMIAAGKNRIKDGNDWNEDYRYHTFTAESETIPGVDNVARAAIAASNPAAAMFTLGSVPEGDSTADMTRYMDRILNHMLASTVKKLKEVLNRYVNITITNITALIPEFMYYIKWAEYIEKLTAAGMHFARAKALEGEGKGARYAHAEGIYNLKLADAHLLDGLEIITNDLTFDDDRCVYILTGANRGGKTTITQAVGQLFALAQGGIYIPGVSFEYSPVDCIYTHFPADEDKTMDLGRLGEECSRFKDIYSSCTEKSLLLLNETFSTTSFEEGYFIARDSVKAILNRGIRTIYNTHMHKLAYDIDEMNESGKGIKACSLIVVSEGGERSFKVEVAPPEGMSYAEDIAKKYGVTFDMLIKTGK